MSWFSLTYWQAHKLLLVISLIMVILGTGFIFVVISGCCFPFLKRLLIVQRLCQMLYASQFYIVNNFEENNLLVSKAKRVKREIIYFPKTYIKIRKKQIEFTIRLDGSRFHQSGAYEELSKTLEQNLGIDFVGFVEKNGYLTYLFEEDNKENRLTIYEVIPQEVKIPLMKGVYWDINKDPHALVVGGTGGGKTYFLQILIRAFVLMGAEIVIGDPKNSDLLDHKRVFDSVYSGTEEISSMIHSVVEKMTGRYVHLRTLPNYRSGKNYSYYGLKPLVLVLDEYVAYLTTITKKADREVVLNDLRQIILKGRQVGVFCILGTQRPDTAFLSGDIRDQLGLRVSLGIMEADGYRMAFGKSQQVLRNKDEIGRGYLRLSVLSILREFYSPWVPEDYDFAGELEALVGMSGHAFAARAKNASGSESADLEPSGDVLKGENSNEGRDRYERSE
ncbi:TPA: DUF87 domain-containing protein [Enterococcus faecalis]|nr:DUF87 domain-containing protein [Enterococcus faecalis]